MPRFRIPFFCSLLILLPILTACLGEGICGDACPELAVVGINGVTTRPNSDGTMDVGISGTGFESGATVTISSVNCYNVLVSSSTYLSCTLPSQNIPIVDIVITNPSGGSNSGSGGSGGGGTSGGGSAYHTVFVTSTTWDGNLGGLSGADSKCATAAASGTKTSSIIAGTWRSILSGVIVAVSVRDRITFVNGAAVKNTNGDTVVNQGSDLWGGSLLSAIHWDQNGASVIPSTSAWTSSNGSGIFTAADCNGWSLSTVSQGGIGNVASTNSNWINATTSICPSFHHLYCINSNN